MNARIVSFTKQGLLHEWPTTKEFKVDHIVSRAKSCVLNISNCSVVLKI